MKLLIWSVFVVVTLLWTGLAMMSIGLTDWVLSLIQSGATMTGQLPTMAVPAWLQLWVDPAWLAAAAATLQPMLSSLGQLMPSTQTLSTLVSVAVWGVWGLGALGLLAAAAGAHWFVGRRAR